MQKQSVEGVWKEVMEALARPKFLDAYDLWLIIKRTINYRVISNTVSHDCLMVKKVLEYGINKLVS
jgi:hypothetical protein